MITARYEAVCAKNMAKDHAKEFAAWQRLNEIGYAPKFPFSIGGTNALSLCDGAD
jgi:hypothetical protein